ncbi:HpcH/HpaI aldolase family protein [Sporomusa sp.]|uniref:HpcH/HpaI aldolase family protein n=1 Tax=Sporomusa sp. TaxID=2078658 RepID=UPI002BEB469D|nr:aldolase/citrate lyase family protein [Sporomusa sp.]HWR45687.1 aldolase/citrate lyase family protein [Sporomusa sp.]
MSIYSLMPYKNKVKDKLESGQAVNGVFYCNGGPAYVEMLGYSGLDFVIIDTEHSSHNLETVENLIRASEVSGMVPIVRVQENSEALIKKALDMGAGGIIVPQVNTAAEARMAVQAAKFGPQGERGVAGITRGARYGYVPLTDFVTYSNKNSLVFTQVEHISAVQNLDEILNVDGLDGILIGPTDLSQSMGITGHFENPEYCRTVIDIIERGVKAKKRVGIFCLNADQARQYRNLGAQLLAVCSDSMLFVSAVRKLADELGKS